MGAVPILGSRIIEVSLHSSSSSARPPLRSARIGLGLCGVWLRTHSVHMQHAQCARTCPPHEAQSVSACTTPHRTHAHPHAHLVCDCRHTQTQAARALTRHVRSHSSLRSRRPNSPSSALRPARDSHHARSARAPHTPPRMDTPCTCSYTPLGRSLGKAPRRLHTRACAAGLHNSLASGCTLVSTLGLLRGPQIDVRTADRHRCLDSNDMHTHLATAAAHARTDKYSKS